MTVTKPKMSASYKAIFILSILMVFFVLLAGAATNSKSSGFGMWIWGYTAWLMYKRRNADLVSFYKLLLWFDVIAAGIAIAVLAFSDSDVSRLVGYTMTEALVLFVVVISVTYGLYRYFLSSQSKPTLESAEDSSDTYLWEKVSEEIKNGERVDSLWTRAFAEADGDNNKANARYIKLRLEQLKSSLKSDTDVPKGSTEEFLKLPPKKSKPIHTGVFLLLVAIVAYVSMYFLLGNYKNTTSSSAAESTKMTSKSPPVNDVKQLCYVYWDGLTFQLGKTEGDKFVRYMKQFYGVDRLEFALPKETVKYLKSQPGNAKLEQIDVADNFVTSNWQRISTICQF